MLKNIKVLWANKQKPIAVLAVCGIVAHVLLRFGVFGPELYLLRWSDYPLYITLLLGGLPLVFDLSAKLIKREFGSDLLAGISIVTAVMLGEYLAGTLVVLMLSGGEAIEAYAVRRASSVLAALAKRMPSTAHARIDGGIMDVSLSDVKIGDSLEVYPHEACPVDGTVIEGHGVMDESYMTGEPYVMSKTPGSRVLSGAINGETVLVIRADKLAVDSRYAKIMGVMRESEQHRPKIRRLADQLGAVYTPIALGIAILSWALSGEVIRFLSVLVVATPCPLLIAIPVAIVGSISLSARLGIIIKDPSVFEKIDNCQTIIFDKTGTLTYGKPKLSEQLNIGVMDDDKLLQLVASLERYSKHPLAESVVRAAKEKKLEFKEVDSISERPGEGLIGKIAGHELQVVSRRRALELTQIGNNEIPEPTAGLECCIVIDGKYAGTYRFRDEPRTEGPSFISHLGPRHAVAKTMLVSGDRESEVKYLAQQVGIEHVYFSQSPEDKLAIVREETKKAQTIFIGDGINDAPALMAATVGIAMGQNSDVTSEAAGAVIMDNSLAKVDAFFHISSRMRSIALQSAVGGMIFSVGGMALAAFGHLPPVAGALAQEFIDVFAVINALRASFLPRKLTDYGDD